MYIWQGIKQIDTKMFRNKKLWGRMTFWSHDAMLVKEDLNFYI